MTVKDYALDLNVSVNSVLDKCKSLGIKVSSENDYLEDDDIIMLDNVIGEMATNEEVKENLLSEELEDKFNLEDRANNLIDEDLTEERTKKVKLKKKDSNKNEDFKKEKKNIYKHKTKLQTNKSEDNTNVILYTDGMTVKDLASKLGIRDEEIIKKMFGMGLILNINQAITFEDAEVVCLEYNKELKKEESKDISNFE